MGLFSRKEACPVCGGEVKGLFKMKIAGKKELCKNCSSQVSMHEDLIKQATPAFIKEHLQYRKKNAEEYSRIRWEVTYDANGTLVGVSPETQAVYIVSDSLKDKDNPVVLHFDEITGYALYRLKKKLDSADDPGDTSLVSAVNVLASLGRMGKDGHDNGVDYFDIHLTTTNPYWPDMKLRVTFGSEQMYGPSPLADNMQAIGQLFKRIVRREPIPLWSSATGAVTYSEAPPSDPVEEIKKCKELLNQGAITEEEFASKKKLLLGI